jgi:HAD superfamily hydrolase (TIGR01509 family)
MGVKALIFDVDGTLAETEECHRAAFNQAFAEVGLDWCWSQSVYRDLLTVTGGRERIAHFAAGLNATANPFVSSEVETCTTASTSLDFARDERSSFTTALHRRKNALYAAAVASGAVALRSGVVETMDAACARGYTLAMATTTSRSNVDALIAATPLSRFAFPVIITGDDVSAKKPDPEVYFLALASLGLPADACLAFEDSVNGLVAATAAGIACVVTPGIYTLGDDFTGAAQLLPSFCEFDVAMFD